jgi:hypothetical protein
MDKDLNDMIELKKMELEKTKKERLLYKLGFYKVNQVKKDIFIGGVNYGETIEEIIYFDIDDKDLIELEKLQKEVDSLGIVTNTDQTKKMVPLPTEKPFISTILNVLGIVTMIISVLVSFPYIGNEILSYIGVQFLVSGVVSGLLLMGFSSVIKYLSEIADHTKR